MSSWGSANAQCHVANGLTEGVYVIASPNPDWVWADLVVGVVAGLALDALSGVAVAEEVATASKALKCLDDLIGELIELQALQELALMAEVAELYKYGRLALDITEATAGVIGDARDRNRNALQAFFQDKSKIDAGRVERVAEESFLEPWRALQPSYWGAISGCETVSLTIVSASLNRFASFNADPDHSWIATPQGVVRARYGALWEPDPGAGTRHWGVGARTEFRPGVTLDAKSFIASPSGRFRLSLRSDGHLAVFDTHNRDELWRSPAAVPGARGVTLGWDGALRILGAGGASTAVSTVSLPSLTPPSERFATRGHLVFPDGGEVHYRPSRVELRDDGELVVRTGLVRSLSGLPRAQWERPEGDIDARVAVLSVDDFSVWQSGVRRSPRSRLEAGASLPLGEELQSQNLQYRLLFRGRGELVLVDAEGRMHWGPGTGDRGASRVTLRPDGRMCVLNVVGDVLWGTDEDGFHGAPGASLVLQDDGNLVIYDDTGAPRWSSRSHARLPFEIYRAPPEAVPPYKEPNTAGMMAEVAEGLRAAARRSHEDALAAYQAELAEVQAHSASRAPQPAFTAADHMTFNRFLRGGDWLRSNNRRFTLTYRDDGDLALTRDDGFTVWRAGARGTPGTATMQDDGNLVVTDAGGVVRWASASRGGRSGADLIGSALAVQDDGNLVVYAPIGAVVWSSNSAARADAPFDHNPPTSLGSSVLRGQPLLPNQCITSPNSRYRFVYHFDGNLTLEDVERGATLWQTWILNELGHRAVLQDDGNLVAESAPGVVAWDSSRDHGVVGADLGAASLFVDDDGGVAIRAESGRILWRRGNASTRVEPVRVGTSLRYASLEPDQFIESEDRRYRLRYQSDGNLVVQRDDGVVTWTTNTPGQPAWRVVMEAAEADLVVCSAPGRVIWRASSVRRLLRPSCEGCTLRIEGEGQLAIRSPAGEIVWCSDDSLVPRVKEPAPLPPALSLGASLVPGVTMERTQWLQSPNGRFKFMVKADERTVAVVNDRGEDEWSVWHQSPAWRVTLASDGDLAITSEDESFLWRSAAHGGRTTTASAPAATLRDDGLLVVLTSDQTLLWATDLRMLSPTDAVGTIGELRPGQSLVSPNGAHRLLFQWDGDLVLRSNGAVAWRSGTAGTAATRVVVGQDGVLLIVAASDAVLWRSTDHRGKTGEFGAFWLLRLTDAGWLYVDANDKCLWSTDPEVLPVPGERGAALRAGERLAPGQWIRSNDGRDRLEYREDGDLALVRNEADGTTRTLWSTGTAGRPAWRVLLGHDGVLDVAAEPIVTAWSSTMHGGQRSASFDGCALTLEDGQLVIRAADGKVSWSTNLRLITRPVRNRGARLSSPGRLAVDERLVSQNGLFSLGFTSDCALALSDASGAVSWRVETRGDLPFATLGTDGELCVCSADDVVAWTSRDHGGTMVQNGSPALILRDDGALVIGFEGNPLGSYLWSNLPELIGLAWRNIGPSLRPGERTAPGQWLESANHLAQLAVNESEFVLTFCGTVVWRARYTDDVTTNRSMWRVYVDAEGDLVVAGDRGVALWRASEHGGQRGPQYAGATLTMQDDGALVVRAPSGAVAWTVNDAPKAMSLGWQMECELRGGVKIARGQWLQNASGRIKLLYRIDGNLVVLEADKTVRWESGTAGRLGWRVVLQNDGNLAILESEGGPSLWNSKDHGGGTESTEGMSPNFGGPKLVFTDDGDIRIYPRNGPFLWHTDTAREFNDLWAYESLAPGQSLVSPNGKHRLIYDPGGGLRHSSGLWTSGTLGSPYTCMFDGHMLTVRTSGGSWSSPEPDPSFGMGRLEVRDDGQVVIVNAKGRIAWGSDTWKWEPRAPSAPPPQGCVGTSLRDGQTLEVGQFIESPNGEHRLICRFDGVLTMHSYGGQRVTWRAGVSPGRPARATLRSDGTLALFQGDAAQPVWVTEMSEYGTWPSSMHAGSTLTLRDSGIATIINRDGVLLWSSDSSRMPPRKSLGPSTQSRIGFGQWLQSSNGRFRLTVGIDGVLSLTGDGGAVLWRNDFGGRHANAVYVTGEGYLRASTEGGETVWVSNAPDPSPTRYTLTLRDDGVAALTNRYDQVVWRAP